MSNRISYTFRRSAFEATKTVSIDGDDLILKEGEAVELRKPLQTVKRMRIAFEPSRVQDSLYTCRIWMKGISGAWITLTSQSYRGFADFEAHDQEYRAFVAALNAEVMRRNPKAVFEAGTSMFMYVLNIGLLILSVAALFWILVLTGGEGWSDVTTWKAGVVLAMIPLVVVWIRVNRPRRYDPHAIPEDLLPSSTD